jgi:hypothetical protein
MSGGAQRSLTLEALTPAALRHTANRATLEASNSRCHFTIGAALLAAVCVALILVANSDDTSYLDMLPITLQVAGHNNIYSATRTAVCMSGQVRLLHLGVLSPQYASSTLKVRTLNMPVNHSLYPADWEPMRVNRCASPCVVTCS